MVRRRYILIVLLLAVVMSSCEKVVDFDPGDVSPYVVVVSKPVSDSLVSVYVGYSRFFLDNSQIIMMIGMAIMDPQPTTVATSSPCVLILATLCG